MRFEKGIFPGKAAIPLTERADFSIQVVERNEKCFQCHVYCKLPPVVGADEIHHKSFSGRCQEELHFLQVLPAFQRINSPRYGRYHRSRIWSGWDRILAQIHSSAAHQEGDLDRNGVHFFGPKLTPRYREGTQRPDTGAKKQDAVTSGLRLEQRRRRRCGKLGRSQLHRHPTTTT